MNEKARRVDGYRTGEIASVRLLICDKGSKAEEDIRWRTRQMERGSGCIRSSQGFQIKILSYLRYSCMEQKDVIIITQDVENSTERDRKNDKCINLENLRYEEINLPVG